MDKTPVRHLKTRYIIVLITLGCLALSNYVLNQVIIAKQESGSAEVNVAGRQRMLSQRIAFLSSQLNQIQDAQLKKSAIGDLSDAINLMKDSHQALIHGDTQMGIKAPASEVLTRLYFGPTANIDAEVKTFLSLAKKHMHQAEHEDEWTTNWHNYGNFDILGLLNKLDKIVTQHQIENEAKIHQLRRFQLVSLVAILLLLSGTGLFVFQPMVSRVRAYVAQLSATEQRFRAIFNQTFQFIGMVSPDGLLIKANNPSLDFINQTEENVVGKFFWDTPWWNHSEDAQRVIKSAVEKAAKGKFIRLETKLKALNGNCTWIDFSLKPTLNENGDVIFLIAEGRDITKRKKIEDRYKNLVESSPVCIHEIDLDGKLTSMNSAGLKMMGAKDESEICGLQYLDIPIEEDKKRIKDLMDQAYAGEGADFVFKAHCGEEDSYFSSNFVPIKDDHGRVTKLMGVTQDITSLKNSEMAMEKAMIEAKRSNKAKSDFLASMSHELRTPLNAVIGFAQMLQYDTSTPLSPNQSENVSHILQGGEHLLNLVNEVLDLSQIESNSYPLTLEDIDLNALVADCVTLMGALPEEKDIRISNNLTDQDPILLNVDRSRMKQILINLLSNAIKFNNKEGIVDINAEITDESFVHLTVKDTGIGIPVDHQNGIFEMFHRHSSDAHIAQEGSGIGLAVSRLLVERMGGEIFFESEEGKGSSFHVRMPLASNMEVLTWSDNLLTGIEPIDHDHQILITLLNKCSQRSLTKYEIKSVVDELLQYAQYHFRREEEIMKICEYDDIEKHQGAHVHLQNEIHSYAEAWEQTNSVQALRELRAFLRNWLVEHIMYTDMQIARVCKGYEVEIEDALKKIA